MYWFPVDKHILGSSYSSISSQSIWSYIRYPFRCASGKLPIKNLERYQDLIFPQDTWPSYPGQLTDQSRVTHGTFFYLASEEGLIANNSIHAGIRCKLAVSLLLQSFSAMYTTEWHVPNVQGAADLENDNQVGFKVISTDDIDDFGIPAIIKHIRERIGDSPVYLRCVTV